MHFDIIKSLYLDLKSVSFTNITVILSGPKGLLLMKDTFYCATIAYHVGLNAVLG